MVVTDFTPSDITDTTIVDPGEKQREQTMGSGQAQRLYLKVVPPAAALRHTIPGYTGALI